MAPQTEAELLTSFLLTPASLPAIVTFDQFRALFPRAVHDSPLLRSLFRDLQAQRAHVMDTVAASIEMEAQRGGQAIRREVARQRREEVDWEVDGEVEMDRAVSFYFFFCSRFARRLCPLTLPPPKNVHTFT